jgi:hypothetical protein
LPGILQPKRAVGQVNDPLEHEADRVAERVIRMAVPGFSISASPQLSRNCVDFDEAATLRAEQAGSAKAGAGEAPDIVHEVLRSPGQPLDASTRAFFEPRFGVDFGAVRVRADAQAAASARAVGARAYTVGSNVVFDTGQFAPRTTAGQRLLAHELQHVLQQNTSRQHRSVQRQALGPNTATDKPADHPVAEGVGNVLVSVGSTMTAEAGLREVYDKCARQITEEALKMVAEGGNTPEAVEKAARWAVTARNDLKAAIRARGSVVTKALAEARNIRKYGDKVGPSYDELIREGKTPPEIIGSSGKANVKLNRAATKLRLAGRLLIAIDLAIVTWEIIEAPEGSRLRTAAGGVGGLAGALAGGELGAIGGAKIGAGIGTFIEPGGGTAVGGIIGGIIGGIGGAIAGGFFGKKGGEKVYDIVDDIFAPNIDADIERINADQDAIIRGSKK